MGSPIPPVGQLECLTAVRISLTSPHESSVDPTSLQIYLQCFSSPFQSSQALLLHYLLRVFPGEVIGGDVVISSHISTADPEGMSCFQRSQHLQQVHRHRVTVRLSPT